MTSVCHHTNTDRPVFIRQMCGLYLIYYQGLDHSILQCTDVCLGLNTLQSLCEKLLSQDCGRSTLNQEVGSRGGQSWLTRCPWGQPQTRKPLRIAAIAGIAERTLRPTETRSSLCSLQMSVGTDAEEHSTIPETSRGGHTRLQPCHSSVSTVSEHRELEAAEMSTLLSETILYLEKDCKNNTYILIYSSPR